LGHLYDAVIRCPESLCFGDLSNIFAEDLLFATLDPTLRKVVIPSFGPAVLVDTVGFIRNLPHHLVNAFRATLEETEKADLLLHVVDLASDKVRLKPEINRNCAEMMGSI